MSGPILLHGGGEFLPGDEAALGTMLQLAAPRAAGRAIRVALVPTAAGRGRPDLAAANGIAAFRRVAADLGLDVAASAVPIVDAVSAGDPSLAAVLREADVIYLPGGDPDLIPSLFPGTGAQAALVAASEDGAVIAGASAGAMALGAWTWTPDGGLPGLGLVPGLTVVPHASAETWADVTRRWGAHLPDGLAVLGLGERTAVVVEAGRPWRVVGEGEARWLAVGGQEPRVVVAGDAFTP